MLSFRRNGAARFPLEQTKSNCSVLEKVLKDVGAQAVLALHPGKKGLMR